MAESIAAQIEREVASWPEVTVEPHRFGGREFRRGRRELGHLHGDRLADLPFPVRVREQLVQEGKAEPHHILPESGWVSRRIRGEDDIPDVIALFRMNYDRPWTSPRHDRERRLIVEGAVSTHANYSAMPRDRHGQDRVGAVRAGVRRKLPGTAR